MLGPGGTAPPQILPSPQFLIGSIVILLSRCYLPNGEGPAPPPAKYFFLQPPLVRYRFVDFYLQRKGSVMNSLRNMSRPHLLCLFSEVASRLSSSGVS